PVLMHRSSARCIPRPTTGASTHSFFSFLMPPRPPRSTLFPYTTLFRSLQQLRFRREELDFAQQLIGVVLKHFADEGAGGFYFTSDRKSTRLNSSHVAISYAVFCLKKKIRHRPESDGGVDREGVAASGEL